MSSMLALWCRECEAALPADQEIGDDLCPDCRAERNETEGED